MKKILLLFALLTLSAGLWAETIDGVKYIDANGVEQTVNNVTKVVSEYEQVTWGAAGTATWYVVSNYVELYYGAVCQGDVHLILADEKILYMLSNEVNEAEAVIQVMGSASLTIYGQKGQSGQLYMEGTGGYGAGIGGNDGQPNSNITINGGNIRIACPSEGASIGGGFRASGSNITINGGNVQVDGTIGGGNHALGFDIHINGGNVSAEIIGGSGLDNNNIFVATKCLLKAGGVEIAHVSGIDIAQELGGKPQVIIEDLFAKGDAAGYARGKTEGYNDGYQHGKNDGDAAGYARGKSEAFGSMGEPCTDCPSIEVKKGDKTVILYHPESVTFKKTE